MLPKQIPNQADLSQDHHAAFPEAWKYQFSAPPAYHGFDLQALWSDTPVPGASFKHAYHKIWGNFITTNSPLISLEDAKAGARNATVPEGKNGLTTWVRAGRAELGRYLADESSKMVGAGSRGLDGRI